MVFRSNEMEHEVEGLVNEDSRITEGGRDAVSTDQSR